MDNNDVVSENDSSTPGSENSEEVGAAAPASEVMDNSVNQLILFWEHTLPRFKASVDRLSGKSLKRVLKAVVESPLNQTEIKFQSNEEREAFLLGSRLQDCKNVMMNLVTAHEALERADKEQNGATQGEENVTNEQSIQESVEGSGLSTQAQGAGQGELPEVAGESESGNLHPSNS